ncbi:MAG: hypothetical protein ABI203_08330 [Mucilaginibacter sp.]
MQRNESDNIRQKLVGNWVLDSVSTASGKYYKVTVTNIITFGETNYSYEWMNGDVGNKDIGKYTICINPNRPIATISCIPNISIAHKDTIRPAYLNFDVIELNATRLQVINQTEFIDQKGKPFIAFNKHSIYKKR